MSNVHSINRQTVVENPDTAHPLWRQWIARHNPRVEVVQQKTLTTEEATFGPPQEFDENLDYYDRIEARQAATVRRYVPPSRAASNEALLINRVIAGYRTRANELARQRLAQAGYTDIPEPHRDNFISYEELEALGID